MPSVLGVDLASGRWQDNGSALVVFDPARYERVEVGVVEWPRTRRPEAAALADTVDTFARELDVAAVSLDGPQGWRDPNDERWGRAAEREARTPGKMGPPGTCVPRTYIGWVTLSVEVFARLLERAHVELANDETARLLPPPPRHGYYLLECFPTSTWRTAGLAPLPAKVRTADTASYAAALERAFGLPPLGRPGHDDLQAVVAALPAVALLGGPARVVPRGVPGRAIGNVWVEGLIWDAASPVRTPQRASSLVVVTGPPATGKTTLAKRLAHELGAPLLAKDAIKEALFDSLGTRDRAWSRDVGNAAFATLFRLLEQHLATVPTVVVEANFAPTQSETAFASLAARFDIRIVQVYCSDDHDAVLERFRARAGKRHRGHADLDAVPEVEEGLANGRWRPLGFGSETVRVAFPPTDADVEAIVRRVQASE